MKDLHLPNEQLRRVDGRIDDELRQPLIEIGFHRLAEGSVLYRAGGTVVLCTASVDPKVPTFLEGKGKGWITAEYQMHPRANARRESREGRGSKSVSGRTHEIQRLIGRSLRAAIDLEALGEHQITVDCDVLEADGGTRTASITGGFVALALALAHLHLSSVISKPVVRSYVSAISVGLVDDRKMLDLVYTEDSQARVDLNLVATDANEIIEVQGTAEGVPISRAQLDAMIDVGLTGVRRLHLAQRAAIASVGVDMAPIFIRSKSLV